MNTEPSNHIRTLLNLEVIALRVVRCFIGCRPLDRNLLCLYPATNHEKNLFLCFLKYPKMPDIFSFVVALYIGDSVTFQFAFIFPFFPLFVRRMSGFSDSGAAYSALYFLLVFCVSFRVFSRNETKRITTMSSSSQLDRRNQRPT